MKRFFGVILFFVLMLSLVSCDTNPQGLGWWGNVTWQYTDTAMGTVIQQIIYADQEDVAQEFSHRVMEHLNKLEKEQISWRESSAEVAKLNATAGTGEAFRLSSEMTGILSRCMEVSERSNGAFDITIGGVTRLWNIDSWAAGEQDGTFRPPLQETIQEALAGAGYDKITLQQNAPTDSAESSTNQTSVTMTLPDGMQLDLGAVGKGIALEQIHEQLKEQTEIKAAVISAGGSVLTYGTKPDGMSWKVGIVDPANTSQNIAVISLDGGRYVATSGDYERYVDVDGVRYHHILDPQTGYPADSGVHSVTIISGDGLLSDALSTACFVLGVEEGMRLAEAYEAEILFVMDGGELVMSEGFPIVK